MTLQIGKNFLSYSLFLFLFVQQVASQCSVKTSCNTCTTSSQCAWCPSRGCVDKTIFDITRSENSCSGNEEAIGSTLYGWSTSRSSCDPCPSITGCGECLQNSNCEYCRSHSGSKNYMTCMSSRQTTKYPTGRLQAECPQVTNPYVHIIIKQITTSLRV
jgi:hypothetical protein